MSGQDSVRSRPPTYSSTGSGAAVLTSIRQSSSESGTPGSALPNEASLRVSVRLHGSIVVSSPSMPAAVPSEGFALLDDDDLGLLSAPAPAGVLGVPLIAVAQPETST